MEARDARWAVYLPGERLAWFAASEQGLRRLQSERRVLRLLVERCSFGVPRVLHVSADETFDVRALVAGTTDPWRLYAELGNNAELAAQLGGAIGGILAEQHTRIGAADVAGWLRLRPEWPESRGWVQERLPRVVGDAGLIAAADSILEAYEATEVTEADRALVHTDLGLHNLAVDAGSYAVHGVFDYDDAAWADCHHDFRYLVFDQGREEMFEAALGVYEPAVGRSIQRERVLLYNAACAVTFLAHRAGKRPEERCCGRTLEEDLRWTTRAIARARL